MSIISFDPSSDAAEVERREDRSLNLMLRQLRFHSEIYRLGLAPDAGKVELLAEILASSPPRPLVVMARQLAEHRAQREAIARFATLRLPLLIVLIATKQHNWAECAFDATWLELASDDAVNIRALAGAIITSPLF